MHAETTVNDTDDFAVGKLLRTLEKMKVIGLQANRRLLRVPRLSHDWTSQTFVTGRARCRA